MSKTAMVTGASHGIGREISRRLAADEYAVIVNYSGNAAKAERTASSITGTHRGEIFGIPPTGKLMDVALREFHHRCNGRITHTWHLEDWFGMLHQIGAWPPAVAPATAVGKAR